MISDQTLDIFAEPEFRSVQPFKSQLLKWVGNKQRFAHEIVSFFPSTYGTYIEPFCGSAAILATLAPKKGIASDISPNLIGIWSMVKSDPATVLNWYKERYGIFHSAERPIGYEKIKTSYNSDPNPADLLFLSRSCYGGVVRFRKRDGYMSTPCGAHDPISPDSFAIRLSEWNKRIKNTDFFCSDFSGIMRKAVAGDIVYCDPPYAHSQAILYGGQGFSLERLYSEIKSCKDRGVKVALSIDGKKKSGSVICDVNIPLGLFEREVYISLGRSMLKRFQMEGESLPDDEVEDRLLLTY